MNSLYVYTQYAEWIGVLIEDLTDEQKVMAWSVAIAKHLAQKKGGDYGH